MKPSLLNISKAMAFATAIGAASAAWATVFPGSTDFEDVTLPDDYTEEAAAVISQIDTPPDVASRPAHYNYASSRTNVLEIDTGADAPVFRELNANGTNEVGTIYVDMLVKPTAIFAPGASPNAGDYDKLLVYFKETSAGTTNLCVYAGYLDNETLIQGECILTTSQIVDKDTWYRLVIKAKLLQEAYPGFNVYLGGYGEDFICTSGGNADFYSLLVDVDNPVAAPSEVAKVGFAGSGFVDDFVASDIDPDAVVTVPFTLTWPSGVTAVSYTLDGGEAIAISGASGMQISVPDGAVVAFTFTNADGVTKTMSATASSSVNAIDASTATYVWADYLGDAVNGAYQIDDAADLNMLRKGVAAGLSTTGETFKQTDDIDFANATFAGIGTYGETSPAAGVPFAGTYDGQGYKISNIAFEAKSYAGVFNQVNGGTIKNLTVENATGAKGISIVGNAGNGATLQNLVAEGSFGSSSAPAGHNAAGIVIRVSGGTSGDGTQILYCTNNATIYGSYTKLAGICAISQEKLPDNPKMVFTGCANNGTLILNRNSNGITGFAGIVGYSDVNTTMTDCSNTGTLTQLGTGYNTDHTGALIGMTYGHSITDGGGNSAASTDKMIGYYGGGTVTGFKYAMVDNGVATTVTTLAEGETYLLEGNVAASETPVFTLTNVGDSIAFDTALGYTFAGTVGNSGAAGIPTVTTKGTVTYYTAGYFPRTATAGQDGTAEHPFEIADLDDLQALQAAVAADVGMDLCYVQTADIALTAAWEGIGMKGGKDHVSEAAYDAEAFTGVYDGGNYTISNFLMENGTDYGALFNSIYNATIKNLKLSWGSSTLCANSSASGGDTGASFVGVAKASTLQNLTTVAGTVTTVSASKDFGGIVGYLMAGSTVESCTNALNVASLKNTGRKCGGIAIITQGGTGTAVIRNCKNSGTVTAANKGGILGYVGVATEIDGCENTAAVQLFHFQSGSVTASGVNKGNATVASNDKSGGVTNLYFATVDGDVATFVADNSLAAGTTNKVMSAGATANFAFAEAGTIAFDTALFTPTYAITAAQGLTLTDATSGTVKTYTAAAPSIPDWATDVDGQSVIDPAVSEKYAAWANNVADGDTTGDRSAQFLMNVPVAAEVALTIDGIEVTSDGTIVTIGATKTISGTTDAIELGTTDAGTGVDTPAINGILNVMVAEELGSWTKKSIPAANLEFVGGKAQVLIPATDGKFVKASVDYSTPASAITEVTE